MRSGFGGQPLSHQIAVVRSWWSAIVSSDCCGQGLVVSYSLMSLPCLVAAGQGSSREEAARSTEATKQAEKK